ncbi:ATPase, E1-E2 type [Trichormus variabilis ATCC 29413]|uniref:ATPase, E1-E2 type n=2 Tax=Anabaena variabilis TaxID=264691 RepID=Q3M3D9_TRIV2|nr:MULTISPECIES: cation-translocating P-type ATPase [Nostocaceae]ABA24497.1 ATPase, E1-E2 type [Trichormus variabilis ATCC 29413]MBC1212903.1 HAD-IC family P-type ATPase [Trichormus variabilis ARAD]MBC1256184.1 HAD-IC family P-type ATPase [Trichormus variabilis V5]MBC1267214.1 HAD-IC family P-type ATPase [Trichormus variabilis FSR]MBC1301348.1 HAD-IC family P-type ATPase [Trichormus variabilis N2B]
MIQAIHTSVKGRARYKVKELYHSLSLKEYLERSLVNQPEIIDVSANISTGNVLVFFSPKYNYKQIAYLIDEVILNYQKSNQQVQPFTSHKIVKKTQRISGVKQQKIENWHLMPASTVVDTFNTSALGLSSESAAANLRKYGANVLSETEVRSSLSILVDQFKSLPVALLGVAAGVSVFTGGLIDAVVILGVVGVNAVIGYATETQSERIIHSLKHQEQTSAWVMRDGKAQEIPVDNVVLGDVLILKPGSYVAADARLIEADNLSIDESALTGESLPVSKNTASLTGEDVPLGDRLNMIYRGTYITGGQGLAVVVATGQFTEMGHIQTLVGAANATETPLARQLDQVGSQLVVIGMGLCGLVFGMGVMRGYGLVQMLKSSISLAVAAVPEGLPTIATTTLALGIRDMRRNKVLVRSLSAVEALGSVQTICLDKTGTITENKMSVVEIHTNTREIKVTNGEFIAGTGNINPYMYDELLKLIHVSVLCNESEVSRVDGEYVVTGSATENALIYMGIAAGVDAIAIKQKYPLLQTNLRSENRNIMSTIHETHNGHKFVAVKGSPSEVVQMCQGWMKDGEVVPLTDADRQMLEIENDRMAGKALRVLGVAYNHIDESHNGNHETDLIWLGLVGMADPIRRGAKALIADFHHAGIDTVMITGDQSPTAYAIAKELELNRDTQLEILDSSNLNNLTPEALTALSDKVDVFARISPSNKLQVVQALQGAGKVVAMTGDGINDAPALKAAQVGVAMGKGGTDVAREVADIVLEDDRLETMIIAVSRGRTIYNNIRKSVHFLLATNLSEIMVMTTATAVGIGEPLNAIQLLWLNLVTDIFPGLSLAMEAPEPEVLSQPPRNPADPIIKKSDFGRITFESATISASTLAAYGYGILKYGISPQASTIAFMGLTTAQLLHTISSRSEKHSIFSPEKLPHNPYLTAAVTGSFGLQLLAVAVPPLRTLLKITPINLVDGAVIGGSALLPLIVNEATKNTGASKIKKYPKCRVRQYK